MVVIDVPKEILQAALTAVASEYPDTLGDEIESLYVELRGLGILVFVEIDPRCSLRHRCGKTYSVAQWEELPFIKQPIPCIGVLQVEVDVVLRECGCGSHIGLASTELVCSALEQPKQEWEAKTL